MPSDPSPVTAKAKRGPLRWALRLTLALIGAALLSLLPLLGVWIGSSMAAHANGPLWLPLLASFLLFPVLPLAWDAYATIRRRRRGAKPRKVSAGARIVLRTLAINGAFVAALLLLWPTAVFAALAMRGDWILDGQTEPWAQKTRVRLLQAADGLEAVHERAKDNPYVAFAEDTNRRPRPTPAEDAPLPTETATGADARSPAIAAVEREAARKDEFPEAAPEAAPAPERDPEAEPTPERTPTPAPAAPSPAPSATWPVAAKLHPLVSKIPDSLERDPERVARYIRGNEPDPVQRVKAIHDFVADRIAYDIESLRAGKYPTHDATEVLKRGKAVCAGYARLFQVMAEAAGHEAEVVAGFSRDSQMELGDGDHAWNAVKIEGQWYLVDVTWDAGSVTGATYEKGYGTDYFLTPPEIFVTTHLPAKPKWQLLQEPVSRGEFLRQPKLRPAFYAKGLKLLAPTRAQVSVSEPKVEVKLANPRDIYLIVVVKPQSEGPNPDQGKQCKLAYTKEDANVSCTLPGPGQYQVQFFGSDDALGGRPYLGQLEVNYRG